MNEILVPNGVMKKLREQFHCSYPTVRSALRGKSKSLLSYKIRQAALQNDGMEIKVVESFKNNRRL